MPSQVKAWVQAPNGDVWAGSETGVREEPPRFEVTSIDNGGGLRDMVVGADGALYVLFWNDLKRVGGGNPHPVEDVAEESLGLRYAIDSHSTGI